MLKFYFCNFDDERPTPQRFPAQALASVPSPGYPADIGAHCGLLGLPEELPVFYGGSITAERQNELYSKWLTDGVMINSSEMTPEQFVKMTADTQ